MLKELNTDAFSGNIFSKCYIHEGILSEWLNHHILYDSIILPAAAYVDMCLSFLARNASFVGFKNLSIRSPLIPNDLISPGQLIPTVILLSIDVDGKASFYTNPIGTGQVFHAGVKFSSSDPFDWKSLEESFQTNRERCVRPGLAHENIYSIFSSFGLTLGPSFRLIHKCMIDLEGFVALSEIKTPHVSFGNFYVLTPALIDALLQSIISLSSSHMKKPRVPVSIEDVHFNGKNISNLWRHPICYSQIEIHHLTEKTITADCALFDASGEAVLAFEGVVYQEIVEEQLKRADIASSADPLLLVSNWVDSPTLQDSFEKISITSITLVFEVYIERTWREAVKFELKRKFVNELIVHVVDVEDLKLLHKDDISETDVAILMVSNDKNFVNSAKSNLTDWLIEIEKVSSLFSRAICAFVGLSESSTTMVGKGSIICNQIEQPEHCMSVIESDSTDPFKVAKSIVDELKAFGNEFEVRYVNERRRILRFSEMASSGLDVPIISRSTSYLITGGLGGLGLLSAKVLVDMGVRQLVLVSRSGLVHSDQGLEERLNWLLEESGADVRVMRCDVSDEASVEQLLERIRSIEGWNGGLEGIIHCAGLIRDGLIRGGQAALGAESVWKSKAYSAYLLDKHTRTDNLKMFVCYSSLSATIGNVGQSSYAAANAFLDFLMDKRRGEGYCGVSIRWPIVSGVGIAAPVSAKAGSSKPHIADISINPAEVELVLRRSLSSNSSAIIHVVPRIIADRMSRFRVTHQTLRQIHNKKLLIARTENRNRESISSKQIEQVVVSIVASLFSNKSNVELDVPLMDLGVDSLGATELSTQLTAKIGVQLSPTLIYSYPTVTSIVNHISSLLSNDDKFTGEDNPVILRKNRLSLKSGVSSLAIIGMSCRLPGDINSLDALYEALSTKRSTSSKTPLTRWDSHAIMCELGYEDKDLLNRINHGSFLSDSVINSFDNKQFGISSAEASEMDPSQRLLLTVAREALMDTGMSLESLRGRRVGVFLGMGGSVGGSKLCSARDYVSVYDATSSTMSVAAGRISFVFDFIGPCMTIDTACSSSLVALHVARQSILHEDCDIALVIAVSVLHEDYSINFGSAGMTSPDGICHSFDQSANGYCRAEGCLAVVLMPEDAAMNNALGMYALVKGSAVQQDGTSASLTAPNGRAQVQLMKEALSNAGVSAKDVGLVEAHGTGTSLGDPIEVEALVSVYGSDSGRDGSRPLQVTSVKGNIGHLEAAAGLAGLFAVVVALQKKQSAPNAQLNELNANIFRAVQGQPISFPLEQSVLKRSKYDKPLLAGLSSFGYSGTISHVVLEESPPDFLRRQESQLYQLPKDLIPTRSSARVKPHPLLQRKASNLGGIIFSCKLHPLLVSALSSATHLILEFCIAASVQPNKSDGNRLIPTFTDFKLFQSHALRKGIVTEIEGVLQGSGVLILSHRERDIPDKTFVTAKCTMKPSFALYTTLFKYPPLNILKVEQQHEEYIKALYLGSQEVHVNIDLSKNYFDASDKERYCCSCIMHPLWIRTMLMMIIYINREFKNLEHSSTTVIDEVNISDIEFVQYYSETFTFTSGWISIERADKLSENENNAFNAFFASLDGEIKLLMKGLRLKKLKGDGVSEVNSSDPLLLTSDWIDRPLQTYKESQSMVGKLLILSEMTDKEAIVESLRVRYSNMSVEVRSISDHLSSRLNDSSSAASVDNNIETVVVMMRHEGQLSEWLTLIESTANITNRLIFVVSSSLETGSGLGSGTIEVGNPFIECITDQVFRGCILSAQIEYPKTTMTVAVVCKEENSDVDEVEVLCNAIGEEISATEAHRELEVRYMNKRRMVRRYSKLLISRDVVQSPVRSEGAYIITGGLGGLGLVTARVLVQLGVNKIVLVSRSGKVAHSDQGLEETLNWLIEESGADVRVLQCDVSDEQALISMLGKVRSVDSWTGGIRGVIHCAGIVQEILIRGGRAAAECDGVWKGKACGAYLLDKYTREDNLSTFICFSSNAATFGAQGRSAYSAANMFLDSLAELRVRKGLP